MRVLFVAPWVPTTRRPRSRFFIETATQYHDTHVVAAAWSKAEFEELADVPASGTTGVRLTKIGAVLRAGQSLPSRRALQQAFVDSSKFKNEIERVSRRFRPDVTVFNVIRSAALVSAVPSGRRLIDLDEFRSAYYRQVSQQSTSFMRRTVARIESPRLARAEREAIDTFDAAVVSSDKDGHRRYGRTPLVIKSAVSVVAEPAPTVADRVYSTRQNIVFVGRMSYGANQEAVSRFLREVWPTLRVMTGAHLHIVGEAPSRALREQAARDDRVTVYGRVPHVAPFLREADVSIVPVTMATGVQMKFIESLAHGTPTVATRLVGDLAGAVEDLHYLPADSAEEWTSSVVKLLENGELTAQLKASGMAWYQQEHHPEPVATRFLDLLG